MRFLVIPLAAAALAGCGRESSIPLGGYQAVVAPETAEPAAPVGDYRINPLDELRIDVFGESELSIERVPVGPNGRFVMPLVGEVAAEGRTPAELSGDIARRLDRYLRGPQVTVNVVQFTSQRVTVTGAVRTAGVFQGINNMTLLDAIALGQGLDGAARADEVLVFRRQGSQRYIARFDLGLIQAGQAANPRIQAGDIVVVGYSNARRLFADLIPILPIALGVFLALAN